MRDLVLGLGVLLASCATPWAQVKEAKTIDEARTMLGAYKPSITPYPPNAEAWYFGKSECVLFVDGKLRMSRTTHTEDTYESGAVKPRPDWKLKQLLCTPSELKEP